MRRQRDDLLAPDREKQVDTDHQRACVPLCGRGKRRIDFAWAARPEYIELYILRPRRFLNVADNAFQIRIGWVCQQRDNPGCRNQLGKQFEPFRFQVADQEADTGHVAARMGKTGNQAFANRIGADSEDDRDCRGCSLGRVSGRRGKSRNQIDPTADEVSGKRG